MLLHSDSSHPDYKRLKNIEEQVESGAGPTSHLLGYARKENMRLTQLVLTKLYERPLRFLEGRKERLR